LAEFAFKSSAFLDQGCDARRDLVGRAFQRCSSFAKLEVAIVQPLPRSFATQCLDAAHAGRNCALGDDLEQLDVAECSDVCPAAQLDRIVRFKVTSHREHADLIAVFLAE
jgi:hypothetical protein